MCKAFNRPRTPLAGRPGPLNQAQQHQQQWRRNTDLLIGRQQPDQKGWDCHDYHRDRQRPLAPELIADVTEDQATQRAHQKPRGKHSERGEQRRSRILGREELTADHRCEIAINAEILPFHDIAGDAGYNSAPLRQPIGLVRTPQNAARFRAMSLTRRRPLRADMKRHHRDSETSP